MEPMMWLAAAGAAIGVAGVIHSTWDAVQHVRADREFVRVLAESDEYRPLILQLKAREEHEGGLAVTEHEAIDLRDRVRQALVYLPLGARKRVEARLYSPTVRGREFYLYKVLYASMQRLQHQT
ncbi:MAG TPA: hypothetical protein VE871_04320 [Longimicrobium sp.]|nr:hypothetical protein [Longimicrobium sp.]